MKHRGVWGVALIGSLLAVSEAHADPAEAGKDTAGTAAAAPEQPAPAEAAPQTKSAAPAGSATDASAPAKAPEPKAPGPEPTLSPVMSRWNTTLYGFIELDAMHDSTQSFADGANGNNVARRGTYAGDRGQSQATIKNTRLGLKLAAPEVLRVKSSAVLEMDFFGLQPTDATQNDFYVLGTLRVRHAYMKFQTPVLDVLVGQYHDLFGWGGTGFYPNTVAFLGVPGEVYHRNPQLRLSKTIGSSAVSLELAAAAVRPVERHSEFPDGEAGIRVAFNDWTGAASQGSGQPQLTPLALGVSAIGRRFVIPQFIGQPRNAVSKNGWGVAANVLIPVIPVRDIQDRGNALTLTGEFTTGTGIADLYTGTTAGARFPELSNPGNINPPVLYPEDVDPGLITFDADNNPKTYNWTAFVLGLQYYLPIFGGKVWVSAIYSQLTSNNILLITPAASWGAVYKSARYVDGNLFAAISPAAQLGLSFQATQQTYGDGAKPTNLRAELGATFFF
jgi:hypothetical protein